MQFKFCGVVRGSEMRDPEESFYLDFLDKVLIKLFKVTRMLKPVLVKITQVDQIRQ